MSDSATEHHRRSIRLPDYDYTSPGAYFVTICVRRGECLLGEVVDGEMQLNDWGQIARDCGQGIPEHFPHVTLDAFVVMPNHVHAILVLAERASTENVGAQHAAPIQDMPSSQYASTKIATTGNAGAQHAAPLRVQAGSLGAVVRSFKSAATQRINALQNVTGAPLWQRNYWEHIIRNEASLNGIREYVENNPARWEEDQLHPQAQPNRFNRWQP